MAIKSYPYVSIDGDRKVTAAEEAQGYDLFVGTGVVPGVENELVCAKVAGTLDITVGAGGAIIGGRRVIVDATETVTLAVGGALPRIDIVCIESNNNTPYRNARLVVVEGTPAATPVAPTLTQTDAVYQLPLAQVPVAAGATNLNAAVLTGRHTYTTGRHGHAKLRITESLTAGTAGVVNIIYGTGDAPSAAGLPDGTLYVKYQA